MSSYPYPVPPQAGSIDYPVSPTSSRLRTRSKGKTVESEKAMRCILLVISTSRIVIRFNRSKDHEAFTEAKARYNSELDTHKRVKPGSQDPGLLHNYSIAGAMITVASHRSIVPVARNAVVEAEKTMKSRDEFINQHIGRAFPTQTSYTGHQKQVQNLKGAHQRLENYADQHAKCRDRPEYRK
ncbi:hypothetical protein K440DRAFT_664995 [Wilcoxina mikolae CBS 423.85]|nr:hypothetical protein K440DRAFT_664995 [Wilcoxina mikolae CBS 423.85]